MSDGSTFLGHASVVAEVNRRRGPPCRRCGKATHSKNHAHCSNDCRYAEVRAKQDAAARECSKCLAIKPREAFAVVKRLGKPYRRPECQDCLSARSLELYRANPKRASEYHKKWNATHKDQRRRYHVKKRYGLSPEDHAAMLVSQGGVCAGCGRPNIAGKDLAVDHCHATGTVRGLLCNKCNTAIGNAGDSATTLRALADYLDRARMGRVA